MTDDWWEAWSPEQIAGRLQHTEGWAVSGGWALDMFAGTAPQAHGELEIVVDARAFGTLRAQLRELQWFAAVDGSLTPYDEAGDPGWQTWGWDATASKWRIDVMREPRDGGDWVYRRHPAVRRQQERAFLLGETGIPFLAPELVLLSRARHPQDEELELVLPWLGLERAGWLADALTLTLPGHPWIARLAMAGSVPVPEAPEPGFQEPEPADEPPEPTYEEPEPAYEEPELVYEEPEPVYEEPELVVEPAPAPLPEPAPEPPAEPVRAEPEPEPEPAADELEQFCARVLIDPSLAVQAAAAARAGGAADRLATLALAGRACRELARAQAEPAPPATAEGLAGTVSAELAAACGTLAERHRETLALRELLGLGYDEIAAVIRVEPAAVGSLLARARLRLRIALHGALPAQNDGCGERDRALRALARRQDGEPLPAEDEDWLLAHLAECPACGRDHAAMLEASACYAAWTLPELAPAA